MKLNALSLPGLSTIAIATLFFASSCKKSNSSSGASGQLSATVGANSFQPTLVVALDNQGHVGIAAIQVKNGDSLFMTVFVPDTAKAGQTVALSTYGDGAITYNNSTGTVTFDSFEADSHGTITVSSFDKTNKKVAGTFSGVLYSSINTDSVKVNGQFNTAYITQ
jgi:hypothetical protein